MFEGVRTLSTDKRWLWLGSWSSVLAFALLLVLFVSQAEAFEAPLETPAQKSDSAINGPFLDVVAFENHLVAVGLYGRIVVSGNSGESWSQAQVPVSTDLVAASFVDRKKGWVVGHGGVVLHTKDGGKNWELQLDGLEAQQLAIDYYTENDDGLEKDVADEMLALERSFVFENETQPFMDVLFVNEQRGYVVGTFNRIFATEDGGETWKPLMHRTDNPTERHFYAVAGNGEAIYLAGEAGKVWRLNPQSGRFESADTPYTGTLFGLLAFGQNQLLAYGMRGTVYLSRDEGSSWTNLDVPFTGGVTDADLSPEGQIFIVDQGGGLYQSQDGGADFTKVKVSRPMSYFGVAWMAPGLVTLVGESGVRVESIF
ncbi:Uncharacterized protein SAMN04487881_0724 [Marinobacter sp. es.048]|nr:Uncharacterized protein SAMN04487881_0724 [Marinobacter sp. es.048]